MKIEKIKINGIENPVGFLLDHITLSYVITDVKQINDPIILEIFKGEELIYNKELDYSQNYATDIDLDLEKGQVLSIIGSSGSGKTTLLRCINFLEKPEVGLMTVDGEVLLDSTKKEKESDNILRDKRLNFGLVFKEKLNNFQQEIQQLNEQAEKNKDKRRRSTKEKSSFR